MDLNMCGCTWKQVLLNPCELHCFQLRTLSLRPKHDKFNQVLGLNFAALLLLCQSHRPPPLDPPTSIRKIHAIHYHYRQEEIQGRRE